MLIAAFTATGALVAAAAVGLIPSFTSPPNAVARTGAAAISYSPLPPYAVTPYGNGLALTPPMGWNPYNHFRREATAGIVKAMALAMVTTHMREAGYQYVNLDGGWDLRRRDGKGDLIPDPAKFPQGIKPVADYVHSLGLKFGIYTSAGLRNCANTSAGSYGHYAQDASAFASWGVDYVKLDWCFLPVHNFPNLNHEQLSVFLAGRMGKALLATGRPMVLDVNDFTESRTWIWAPRLGNMWRTASDIQDNYRSMLANFLRDVSHYPAAGPDHWNDPDMLEVGNGGMTPVEYRAQFSLWAELAAPLIAGNDLTTMSRETLSILTNSAVIAVDQDPLGSQGYPVSNARGHWVLTKPMANGDRAVVLFNQTGRSAVISTSAAAVGLSSAWRYLLRDLWAGAVETTTGKIVAEVPAHGVVMYLVTPAP